MSWITGSFYAYVHTHISLSSIKIIWMFLHFSPKPTRRLENDSIISFHAQIFLIWDFNANLIKESHFKIKHQDYHIQNTLDFEAIYLKVLYILC